MRKVLKVFRVPVAVKSFPLTTQSTYQHIIRFLKTDATKALRHKDSQSVVSVNG
jgi:hypothetical protein